MPQLQTEGLFLKQNVTEKRVACLKRPLCKKNYAQRAALKENEEALNLANAGSVGKAKGRRGFEPPFLLKNPEAQELGLTAILVILGAMPGDGKALFFIKKKGRLVFFVNF